MKQGATTKLADLIVSRPLLWLVMTAVLLGVAAAGLRHISLMPDLRVFFSPGNPDKVALDRFERSFVREDTALIALEPASGEVFTPETMRALADVVERAWRLPYVRRVDAVTNFQDSRGDDGSVMVGDLIPDPAQADAAELADARARALDRVEIRGALLNDDASMTLVRVLFVLPGKDPRSEVPEVDAALAALIAAVEAAHPGQSLYLTGTVPMNATFMEAARADLKTLVPGMVLLVLVVTALALQLASAALMTLCVIIVASASAVSALAWAGIPLNTATATAPLIVMTLGVASTTHFLSGVRRAMHEQPGGGREVRRAWARGSLVAHLPPLALANLTTAAGFLALNFSISPPFQQLGNSVAVGVLTTLLLTLTLLPALVILVPVRARTGRVLLHDLAGVLSRRLTRRPMRAGILFLLVGAPVLSGIGLLSLEDDFVAYFDHGFEFRRDTDYIEQRLTGLRAVEFPVWTGEENGIYSPALLTQVDRFVGWLRARPEVVSVQSPTDTLKQLSMNMNADAPDAYRLPERRDEAAQYLLLYEMSLGYGMDLTDRITVDRSALRVTAVLRHVTTADIRELEADAADWLAANAPDIQTSPTGLPHVFTLIAYRDARAMLVGTLAALVAISVVIMLALRSWRLGLLSLVPNLIPILLAFGFWGHLSGQVTLAVSVVAAMTFGIVVDDTIHMVSGYARRRRLGLAPLPAIRDTIAAVGGALIATSGALFLGFMVMASSGFAVNSDMAYLSGITIVIALAADLMLLPMLLLAPWLGKLQDAGPLTPQSGGATEPHAAGFDLGTGCAQATVRR